MPRPAHEEVAALKLVDNLFIHQISMQFVIDHEELSFYKSIAAKVRQKAMDTGRTGYRVEDLINAALWEMEYTRAYRSVMMFHLSRPPAGEIELHQQAVTIKNEIFRELSGTSEKPRPWFSRLNEKVLLAEQPDAPSGVLAWLIDKSIISTTIAASKKNDELKGLDLLVYRAIMLLNTQNVRTVVDRRRDDVGTRILDDLLAAPATPENAWLRALVETLKETPGMDRERIAHILKVTLIRLRNDVEALNDRAVLSVDSSWWEGKEKKQISELRDYMSKLRFLMGNTDLGFISKAKAASLLGAALVLMLKKNGDERPTYSERKETGTDNCLAGVVAASLNALGLKVNPRTINDHLPKSEIGGLYKLINNLTTEYQKQKRFHRSSNFGCVIPKHLNSKQNDKAAT